MPQKLSVIISTIPAQNACQIKGNKDIEIDINYAA